MHSTHLRKKHIHGGLLGIAIGESLAYSRRGLGSRQGLRLYGRPGQYSFLPRIGVYGEQTRLALLYSQALLNSRNEMSNLRPAFRWRLGWYLLSLPPGTKAATLRSAAKCWLRKLKIDTSTKAVDCSTMSRSILSGSIMHGTGHRITRWAEEITRLTHSSPLVLDANRVLAVFAGIACTAPEETEFGGVLQAAIEVSEERELREALQRLEPHLKAGSTPGKVMKSMGWDKVADHPVPACVMGSYCWLRYPKNFLRSTLAATRLGGAVDATAVVAGGLSGTHLGEKALPKQLKESLACGPHDAEWIQGVADRFSHWPHGADDLYMAPAQTSDPLGQVGRSLYYYPVHAYHAYKKRFR
ncbi:MAG: ADP-ribosylglycohydrolase family protein [Aureliella sp.]